MTESNDITRRELFTGAAKLAVGGAVLASAGTALLTAEGCSRKESGPSIQVLEVAQDSVVTLDSFTLVKKPNKLYKMSDLATLPSGVLLRTSSAKVAAALCTGETASPLSTVSLINLSTGENVTVLKEAVGHEQGYSLYDAMCSSELLTWVESNYLTGDWRVFCAPVKTTSRYEQRWREVTLSQTVTDPDTGEDYEDTYTVDEEYTAEIKSYGIGKAVMVDEGNADYDAPEIATVGNNAYWIVQPADGGSKSEEDSLLKVSAGGSAGTTCYTSHGRFNGGLQVSGKVVTAMPRAEASGVYYQMTALQGSTVVATQVLPRAFRPTFASYVNGRFSFAIGASYDYGDGIANVGTYYPMDNGQWLRLTRQPVTPIALCRGWLVSKSGSRTVFVDMTKKRYYTIDAPSSSASYGDYPVRTGSVSNVFNYAAVTEVDGSDRKKSVQVRKIVPVKIS